MKSTHICSPLDQVTQNLEIRQATTKFEIDQLRTSVLNAEHYLKAGRPAGNTIYKASHWIALGFSKGYRRHKSDFYTDEKSPKKY